MTDDLYTQLGQHIETAERAYEFMLAYAAQGYEAGQGNNVGNEIQSHLTALDDALAIRHAEDRGLANAGWLNSRGGVPLPENCVDVSFGTAF